MPPALFFFLRVAFTILGLLWFHMNFKIICSRDFAGGPVVKHLHYNAGDTGLIPGQGTEMPHAAGQLSPCATTTELTRLN